jgi:uncharacterized circularly permuted ATP-grasp superfamily protein
MQTELSPDLIQRAVTYYHELLEDPSLSVASREILDQGLGASKLIFGGRRLTPYLRPHFITESDWKKVSTVGETVFGALQKVKDAAVEDDLLLDELGITEIERDLVKIDPGYLQVSPTARLDSFLASGSYSYVELNGESPAGIAYADSATEIFNRLPIMQRFAERYTLRGFEGSSKMLDVLLTCFYEFVGGSRLDSRPSIAIVDLPGLPTQAEFELFEQYFEYQGHDTVIATPQELEYDGKRLTFKGLEIDIVYKRLLVNEYLPIMNEYPALLNAYRDGAVCLVNSFQSKLIHKKAVFAVITNERYEHLFTEVERRAIDQSVPWTRRFRWELTTNNNEKIDLVEWTRLNKEKLVLKPNDDYGGHGIYIGWNATESEWDEAIEHSLANGDYLVQERVKTAKEKFPMLFGYEGDVQMIEQLVDLDPLLFNGIVGSAFTRLSSSELANVTAGGGMVPTFIISEKN